MLSQYLDNLEKRYKKPQQSNLGIALRSELAKQIIRQQEGSSASSRLTYINANRDMTTIELGFQCGGSQEGGEILWDAGEMYDHDEDYHLIEERNNPQGFQLRLDNRVYEDYDDIYIFTEAEDDGYGGEYEQDNFLEARTATYPIGFAIYVEGAAREELNDQYRLPFSTKKLQIGSRYKTQKKLFLIVDRDRAYSDLEEWAKAYASDFAAENEGQELEIEIIRVDQFDAGFLRDAGLHGGVNFRNDYSQYSVKTNIRGMADFLNRSGFIDLDTMYRLKTGAVDLVATLELEYREFWSWPVELEEGGDCDITFTVNGSMMLGGGRRETQTVFAFVTREVKHWVETLEPEVITFSGTKERISLYDRLAKMIEANGYKNLTTISAHSINARLVREY